MSVLMRKLWACLIVLLCVPALQAATQVPSAQLSAAEKSAVDAMVLPVPPAWVGDLDGMRERRTVRILVPYSKTFYLLDRGRQHGIVFEFGRAFEEWLNKTRPLGHKAQRWQVIFIPTARNELMPKLLAGYGDIAAGGLTVTEARLQTVDFSDPVVKDVSEGIVTGPGAPVINKLEDLAGQDVYVRPSSSYFEHLLALNTRFEAQGLEPVNIMPVNENLETEDILQMVNAGLFGITVADSYIAELWQPLYTDLLIHDAFYLQQGNQLSWALRKNSPQLLQAANEFIKGHKMGTEFGNIMLKRYFKKISGC